ncbi:sugar ABC transporter substrate-binding protein [Tessaracoccus flavus]|uniref:Maltose ABC transporter substrate-binding protein n=1 Tax=Tessaracoccus flavus TaxID=1610493 RepID=A0A1Q2CCA4_9ACTN|nr:maltose ABC transporter substrate-binding protein [Tessaracoccus flavus]AQP43748.1 maltose ABC transporter substrate-binding protein [Tessaracoccus flavus]SDY22718.1 carbohydrate ABC transporter substrate-binding protein, CUT1 family [Tessaracoccus flavus]
MRKSLFAAAAVGLSLTLVACGGDASETTTTPTPTDTATAVATETTTASETAAPGAAGTLTIWVDDTRVDAFKTLGEDFLAQTGVTLDVVQKPTGDIKTDFIAQAPTGEGPDLIVTAHDAIGDLVSNGVISAVELGDKVDAFSDVATRAVSLEGTMYAVPYGVENIGLVRNNALVQDTPATFDELIAQGKAVEGAEFPIVIQQGEGGDPYHLYPLQTSFGAPVFKTDENGDYIGELAMGGAEGEAFATYMKKLVDEGVLSASIGGDQAKQAFLDGKSPYMITGPWNTTEFAAAGMDISVLPVPSAGGQPAAPFVGVQAVFASSQSENPLLANQFLDYMASKEAQDKMYELRGLMPALTESADAVEDEILAGFAEAGAQGEPMPGIPQMGAVWTFWGNGQVAILTGAAEPVPAWQDMIANIEGAF